MENKYPLLSKIDAPNDLKNFDLPLNIFYMNCTPEVHFWKDIVNFSASEIYFVKEASMTMARRRRDFLSI